MLKMKPTSYTDFVYINTGGLTSALPGEGQRCAVIKINCIKVLFGGVKAYNLYVQTGASEKLAEDNNRYEKQLTFAELKESTDSAAYRFKYLG